MSTVAHLASMVSLLTLEQENVYLKLVVHMVKIFSKVSALTFVKLAITSMKESVFMEDASKDTPLMPSVAVLEEVKLKLHQEPQDLTAMLINSSKMEDVLEPAQLVHSQTQLQEPADLVETTVMPASQPHSVSTVPMDSLLKKALVLPTIAVLLVSSDMELHVFQVALLELMQLEITVFDHVPKAATSTTRFVSPAVPLL
eukprot:TRINITY_DN5385_c0_g1_i1.p3 TRINITY_DN5385_c0_g1~~TRINITY_DN5385_c0_g1_i1.p3  ORF type:complete len:200 (-),score=34.93 TRINITY_DN5385_c0_g1_i1:96-695(-)